MQFAAKSPALGPKLVVLLAWPIVTPEQYLLVFADSLEFDRAALTYP